MPNASANRADVRYVAEVSWGVTPATPALKLLRMTGESLNANIQTAVSQEIRPDRDIQDIAKIGSDAGGGVDFELSYGSFDDMLEAAMCNTWVVDGVDTDKYTIVNGVVEKSFSIQKRFADVARYMLFTGARVNTLSLRVEPGKIVTGSLGFMCKAGTPAAAGVTGATYPAGNTNTPMNGSAGVTLNQIDAAAIPGGLMNFSLNINNNLRAQDAIGTDSAQAIVQGSFEATGDFEVYFADGTLYDKFDNQTPFATQIKIAESGATKEIWIDLPRAKFETGEVVARGTNTDVMFKATYRALYDSVTAGSVKLTRNGPL